MIPLHAMRSISGPIMAASIRPARRGLALAPAATAALGGHGGRTSGRAPAGGASCTPASGGPRRPRRRSAGSPAWSAAATSGSWVIRTTVRPSSFRRAKIRKHVLGGVRVQVAGRLVGEDQRGVGHDRPRDRDTLLLAAGQLRRLVVAGGCPSPPSAVHARRAVCALRPSVRRRRAAAPRWRARSCAGTRLKLWKTKPILRLRRSARSSSSMWLTSTPSIS